MWSARCQVHPDQQNHSLLSSFSHVPFLTTLGPDDSSSLLEDSVHFSVVSLQIYTSTSSAYKEETPNGHQSRIKLRKNKKTIFLIDLIWNHVVWMLLPHHVTMGNLVCESCFSFCDSDVHRQRHRDTEGLPGCSIKPHLDTFSALVFKREAWKSLFLYVTN